MTQSGEPQGYSIFADTMADMTYPEVAAAAEAGAVALWGMGVIEEHGPHLPLGTDVYLPNAILRRARALLSERNIPSVIVPAFYWGVNHVTSTFPGSFEVRPEVMVELMSDIFASLKKDGFRSAFCLSGHGDMAHNLTIVDGVRRGCDDAGLEARMVVSPALAKRLTDASDAADTEDYLLVTAGGDAPAGKYLDIHAGEGETSLVWALCPDLVRTDLLSDLEPTNLEFEDLLEWRKGREHAAQKTPDGYFGNPAVADPAQGRDALERRAAAIADAIAGR